MLVNTSKLPSFVDDGVVNSLVILWVMGIQTTVHVTPKLETVVTVQGSCLVNMIYSTNLACLSKVHKPLDTVFEHDVINSFTFIHPF